MRKNLLAMISMAVMTTMLITGCGGSGNDKQASAETENKTASAESAEENTADDSKEETGGSYKIGMVVNYAGQDPYQTSYYDTMVAYAKEKGVDLQIRKAMQPHRPIRYRI